MGVGNDVVTGKNTKLSAGALQAIQAMELLVSDQKALLVRIVKDAYSSTNAAKIAADQQIV